MTLASVKLTLRTRQHTVICIFFSKFLWSYTMRFLKRFNPTIRILGWSCTYLKFWEILLKKILQKSVPCYTHTHMGLGWAWFSYLLECPPPIRTCGFSSTVNHVCSFFLLENRAYSFHAPQPAIIVPMGLWTVFPLPQSSLFISDSLNYVSGFCQFFFPHPLFQNPLSKCESLRLSFLPADCWQERQTWRSCTPHLLRRAVFLHLRLLHRQKPCLLVDTGDRIIHVLHWRILTSMGLGIWIFDFL